MLDSYQPQVDAINKNGITVSEEDGTEQHFSSVRACLSGEYKEDADLVIVFVKSCILYKSSTESVGGLGS